MPTGRELITELLALLAADNDKPELDYKYAALYENKYVDALVKMQESDPVAFETSIKEINRITKMPKGPLREHVDKRAAEIQAEKAAKDLDIEEYPTSIKQAGDNILSNGKVMKFLLQQYHKNHIGDNNAGKVLFLSFVSGSSLTSSGLQPGITGDAQIGKTDAMLAVLHCLPKRWSMDTGLSDKAAFYIDFKPGQVVFSDDIIWTQGLAYMFKEAMSKFQSGARWTTVMKINGRMTSVTKDIPPLVLWWLTSADGAPDDQVESRQYPLDVDTTLSHAIVVSDSLDARRQERKIKFAEDKGILTARYILDQIRQKGPFKVVIPYAKQIDYKLKKDYRGHNQFLDLIDALAILNHKQREVKGGYIEATIDDFQEAQDIFSAKNESHATGLTTPELEIVRCMAEKDTWTQEELSKATGKSQSTISKRLNAIMGKTAYITKHRGYNGEDAYKLTDKVDFGIFGNAIVDLKQTSTEEAAA